MKKTLKKTLLVALVTAFTAMFFCFGVNAQEVGNISSIKANKTNSSITLSWKKAKNAEGYRIYKKASGKWKAIGETSSTTYNVKKLKANTQYVFSVRPYADIDESTLWGSRKKIAVRTNEHNYITVSERKATLLTEGRRVEKCDHCRDEKVTTLKKVNPTSLDIPVVYISDYEKGETPLVRLQKSDGEILVRYKYVSNSKEIKSFDCFCKIKVQGASSSRYPKKNFTVKFFKDTKEENKFKVNLGWGKEDKYCMKANYIDASHARNIVGANLFSEIVESRKNINPGLKNAPNYGLIDGYPVLVYVNGTFHGIYTMNIPKDDWMFGMEGEEESREALLMADRWTDSVRLYTPIDKTYVNSGWEVEHCSTEDDRWVRESFNKLINLLNCGDNARIKKELPEYLDIEAAIDNMIFTYYISAADNLAKNILWATYDGKKWIPSMYDMDGTFGIYWNGSPVTSNYTKPSLNSSGNLTTKNRMYQILMKLYRKDVTARWDELRESVLTNKNMKKHFKTFSDAIPDVAFTSELQKWSGIPAAKTNRKSMYGFTQQHTARLDKFFKSLKK